MLCVRVPASLRKRAKLAAIQSGRSVQEFATEALEAECRRRGV
jgi:predicted HicB family RNase H-like nuclease